jgi:hypothetical protein
MKFIPSNFIKIVSEFHKSLENIGSGHDADQFVFMDDRQSSNFIFGHDRCCIGGSLFRLNGHDATMHDILNPYVL